MAFEEGTTSLTCVACNAKHVALWSRMPVRERQTVCCLTCGGIIFEDKSVRFYHSVKIAD